MKRLVDYQHKVDKDKLIAATNFGKLKIRYGD